MKTIESLLSIIALIFFVACNRTDKKEISKLNSKVYQTSFGLDNDCNEITKPTDYFQTLLFLNDSVFISIQNTCCGEPGEDFAYEYYCKGLYSLDDQLLILKFKSPLIVLYKKEILDSIDTNLSHSSTHTELEKMDTITIKLSRLNCKDVPYFKQTANASDKDFMTPIRDDINEYKKRLEKLGIWENLFPAI
jgi:hypothetical protein